MHFCCLLHPLSREWRGIVWICTNTLWQRGNRELLRKIFYLLLEHNLHEFFQLELFLFEILKYFIDFIHSTRLIFHVWFFFSFSIESNLVECRICNFQNFFTSSSVICNLFAHSHMIESENKRKKKLVVGFLHFLCGTAARSTLSRVHLSARE